MKVMATILLTIFLAGCATVAPAESVGTDNSSGFIEQRFQRIDDVINGEIEAGKIPGAVALIAKGGDIAYHRAFGLADIESGRNMQTDDIFRIASMTKAITSVGVMMLYEQGHFQLNDPVSKYLPAFGSPKVVVETGADGLVLETRDAEREIRIVDLLTHSAGIGYAFIPSSLQATYKAEGVIDGITAVDATLADGMALLARQPIAFDPGESYMYGLNTDVLGYLIEVVSRKSLDRFFREEIFEPLGMVDTYFYIPDSKSTRLVTLYADVGGLRVSDGTEDPLTLDNPRYPVEGAKRYFSGGGGLSSTAEDYFRFVQMLLNEGELDGNRVLGRKSVELMHSARVDMDGDGEADFGLGFQVIGDLGQYGEIGTTGAYAWGGAFGTSYWIDPDEDLVAVFMTQVRPMSSDIRNRFRTAVYQALK